MSMWIKKLNLLLLSVAIILLPASSALAARKQLNIGTGFIGSSMHALGTVLAKHMQTEMRMRVTARPYVGPSAFIPLVNNGELSMGLISMAGVGTAYAGTGVDASKDVRVIARLFAMPFAFITRKNSGIETVFDLKGKKVVLNIAAAQAVSVMAQGMIETAGLSADDVQVIKVSGVGRGIEAVVEGNADAAPGSVSMSAVRKADATIGVRVLNLVKNDYEQRLQVSSAPGLRTYLVDAGSHPGVEIETRIFAMDMFLVVPSVLEDEDVIKILDVLHKKWPDMQKDFTGLAAFSTRDFVHSSQTVPYHAAAIEYYKNGNGDAVWDDNASARNQKLLDIWN